MDVIIFIVNFCNPTLYRYIQVRLEFNSLKNPASGEKWVAGMSLAVLGKCLFSDLHYQSSLLSGASQALCVTVDIIVHEECKRERTGRDQQSAQKRGKALHMADNAIMFPTCV